MVDVIYTGNVILVDVPGVTVIDTEVLVKTEDDVVEIDIGTDAVDVVDIVADVTNPLPVYQKRKKYKSSHRFQPELHKHNYVCRLIYISTSENSLIVTGTMTTSCICWRMCSYVIDSQLKTTQCRVRLHTSCS